MPIFEYQCQDCGHVSEFLEKRAGAHKHKCEQCRGSNLEKLLSSFSVGHGLPQICKSCPDGSYRGNMCPPGGCCGQS